jgi:hypothetical protein
MRSRNVLIYFLLYKCIVGLFGDIYIYHILVDDKAKILPCNKTLSFV